MTVPNYPGLTTREAKFLAKHEHLKKQSVELYNISKPLTANLALVGGDSITDRELKFWADAEAACDKMSFNDITTLFEFSRHRYSGVYW